MYWMTDVRNDELWPLLTLLILVLIIGIRPELILNIINESTNHIIYSIVDKT